MGRAERQHRGGWQGVSEVLGWGAVLAVGLGCAWEGLRLLVQAWGTWPGLSQLWNVTFLVRCALESHQSVPAWPKVQSVRLAGGVESPVVQVSSKDSSLGCDKGHPLVTKPTGLQPQRQLRCYKAV